MTPAPSAPRFPRAVVRSSRWTASLIAIAVVGTMVPLPWGLVGLPAAIGAIAAALVAMVAMRKGASPGLWVSMGAGLVISGTLTLGYVGEIAFYDAFVELQTCRGEAITLGATNECQAAFQEAVTERLSSLEKRLTPGLAPSSSSS